MNLLDKYKAYIQKEQLFGPKDKLLIAVSGGVDSVVLCELCKQSGYDFVIAHCNFQLRGAESNRDEAFVRQLGAAYGVAVLIKHFDTNAISKTTKKSIEETARDLRYAWFNELTGNPQEAAQSWLYIDPNGMEQVHCPLPIARLILTAHHADDNIETLMMNFFRGTGIKGLHGILPRQGKTIRPLLFATRAELEAFAAENKIAFVTDSTNAENEYTRNFFRNQLIPLVTERFPGAKENLVRNIKRFGEAEILYDQAMALHRKRLLEQKGSEVYIPVLKLQKSEPLHTIMYEIISGYGFTAHQTADALALLQSESGKYIQSGSHRIIRNRKWLIISPVETVIAANILVEEKDAEIQFPGGHLQIKRQTITDSKINVDPAIAMLDASAIRFPLLLRRWKQGDYFYPLGMQKKKKLSRFFIDQKLSLSQKEKIWVIESGKKIVWVVGMRIDDRVKIADTTKAILCIEYIKNGDA